MHESASVLRYTHITCRALCMFTVVTGILGNIHILRLTTTEPVSNPGHPLTETIFSKDVLLASPLNLMSEENYPSETAVYLLSDATYWCQNARLAAPIICKDVEQKPVLDS